MTRYVAFLRAINVGGRTVKMARLRELMQALGLANVETFIASGNVLFDAPVRGARGLKKKIASRLHEGLGFEVDTFLRSAHQLAEVAAHEPFDGISANGGLEKDAGTLYIGFLADAPGAEARNRLLALRGPSDDFAVHQREVYWLCRKGMGQSDISGAALERVLGMPATFRNANTVRKLAAKTASAP